MSTSQLRMKALLILENSANGDCQLTYNEVIQQFLDNGGNVDDIVVKIAVKLFDFVPSTSSQIGPQPQKELCAIPGSARINFDYLNQFMIDCFQAVGVPSFEATVCASVLLDADINGIDSHGVGRLKASKLSYMR